MLPRLRFVIAAAVIAALPWIVFGSGFVADIPAGPVADYSRQSSSASFGASDLRDARAMYLMSYVRRSRELERLRELASAPLSDWVAAPSGRDEPAPASPQRVREDVKTEDVKAEVSKTEVAALPVEPAAVSAPDRTDEAGVGKAEEAKADESPSAPGAAARELETPALPPRTPLIEQAALHEDGPADLETVTPLPRHRPPGKILGRPRHPARFAARAAPPPLPPVSAPTPNPFAGPPAPPTTSNSFAQQYGRPF